MFNQTLKNFSINFNALNERNTVSSGDVLTGHLSFDLTKQTKITSIAIELKGKAEVHWSTGGGGGGGGRRGRRHRRQRRHYSAKLEFFKLRSVIVQEHGAVEVKLQPGTHVYPFTCQLPPGDFPASFRGPHGRIMYSLTVSVDRPWHLSKDFETQLNFVNRINTNQPVLQAPLKGSNNMTLCCLWCASGPITLTGRTEKKAFVPGETIKIICDISNASSRTATPKVRLLQKQFYYTHNRVSMTMAAKTLASVTGRPINAHTSDVQTEIMLTVPSNASLSISNCSILAVENLIEVNLCVTASPDLTVLFPIILCDTPVNAFSPHYILALRQYNMSGDVKKFMLGYNPINSSNTFTSGDCVTGQVTFELDKDCKIDSLSVKLKGKAEVRWSEHNGQHRRTYHSKLKYFSIKEVIIQKGHGKNLPPSFNGKWGKIVYTLEANLSRSMRTDKKAKAYLTLVHNVDPRSDPVLMTPQGHVTEKKMLFTSGRVTMDVHIERMGFHQGEGIKVVASILNRSSRDIKPKYCLYMKQSFFSKKKRKLYTKDVLKEVGDAIPPSASPTVTRILTIPPDMEPSILNCEIVRLEYRLRVYLDIKYALDPEIKFPIVILPALRVSEEQHHQPAYPVYGSGTFANSYMSGESSFLQNSTASGPSAPPPPYETYEAYPSTPFSGKY
ncbi:Arrestin domain-containing protein 3 [Nibea albiflora]|uniref:Arrestin domain-containing protein 3 n=1 Tax=Nibea albiflora TaxID=240163 RepID=A0ACB7FC76_NIBAL|nr:Arrestin domain-containing protein 3 [Nibea albiflora]